MSVWRTWIVGAVVNIIVPVLASQAVASEPTKIRIAYQSLWSPMSEVYSVLRNTDILRSNGLTAEFTAFTYAGPMGEAIGAGLIDTAYGGWMPALAFLKTKRDWKFVSTIIDFEWHLVVGDPKITRADDLKGKTLAVPWATLVHLMAVQHFRRLGIDKEVTFINVDAAGLIGALKAKGADGFVGWHPIQARALELGVGKVLPIESDKMLRGLQLMSGDFIQKHPEAAVAFLKSLTMAFSYASKNRDQVIGWYLRDHPDARILKTLLTAGWDVDRHLKQPREVKEIDLRLKPQDVQIGQSIASLGHELGFLPKLNVADLVNTRLMERGYSEIQSGR